MRTVFLKIRAASIKHWAAKVAVLVCGLYASHLAHEHKVWIDMYVFQWLSELGWRVLEPKNTVVVLINDEAFWRRGLAGRQPLKRDYLRKVVGSLDCAGADVIALDVDLRSPDPGGHPVDHEDYSNETKQFLESIRTIASGRHRCVDGTKQWAGQRRIVLSGALGSNARGQYVKQSNVYDPEGFCQKDQSVSSLPVYCGYLELATDIRVLPPKLQLNDGSEMASFALAIVEAKNRKPYDAGGHNRLKYGSYIPKDMFEHDKVILFSEDVVQEPVSLLQPKVEGKIVLIGGSWSELAYGRGALVDSWPSPVGPIPGVLLHTNYVEAILDGRTYKPMPETATVILEASLLVVCLLAFEYELRASRKLGVVAAVLIVVAILGYVAFENLGIVFDIFVPLVFIVAHALFDQIYEWRSAARRHSLRQRIQ